MLTATTALLLSYTGPAPLSRPALRAPQPICADVYGRSLSSGRVNFFRPPQDGEDEMPSVTTQGGGSSAESNEGCLKAATLTLSTHDKLALTSPGDPMMAFEEYYEEHMQALSDAVKTLNRHSSSIMLGVMGDHAEEAVDALRSWQRQLNLPQPPLQVLVETPTGEGLSDPLCDSVAKAAEKTTPAYLKYNSRNEFNMLKPHEGPFRGVIITANFNDGSVRQYGGLPLALFEQLEEKLGDTAERALDACPASAYLPPRGRAQSFPRMRPLIGGGPLDNARRMFCL